MPGGLVSSRALSNDRHECYKELSSSVIGESTSLKKNVRRAALALKREGLSFGSGLLISESDVPRPPVEIEINAVVSAFRVQRISSRNMGTPTYLA